MKVAIVILIKENNLWIAKYFHQYFIGNICITYKVIVNVVRFVVYSTMKVAIVNLDSKACALATIFWYKQSAMSKYIGGYIFWQNKICSINKECDYY
jgi:hypothetical protein